MPSSPEDDNRDPKPNAESPFRQADLASVECELAEISSQLDPRSKGELLSNIRRELDSWREGINPQFEMSWLANNSTENVDRVAKEVLRLRNMGCVEILRYANAREAFTTSDLLRGLKRGNQIYDKLTALEKMHLILRRQESFSEAVERDERVQRKQRRRISLYKISPRGKAVIEMIDRMNLSLDSANRVSLVQRFRKLLPWNKGK